MLQAKICVLWSSLQEEAPGVGALFCVPGSFGFQMSPVFRTEGLFFLFSVRNPLKEGGEFWAWLSSRGGNWAAKLSGKGRLSGIGLPAPTEKLSSTLIRQHVCCFDNLSVFAESELVWSKAYFQWGELQLSVTTKLTYMRCGAPGGSTTFWGLGSSIQRGLAQGGDSHVSRCAIILWRQSSDFGRSRRSTGSWLCKPERIQAAQSFLPDWQFWTLP